MNQKIPNGGLAQAILDQFDHDYLGHAIDVGASDGITCNTTYLLESRRWTVLSVEANPDFRDSLNACRALVEICACSDHAGVADFHINTENPEAYSALTVTTRTNLKGFPNPDAWRFTPVKVWTVDDLIRKWDFPKLDVLCVDTEGTELDVLHGCDLAFWRPRVIVTECWDDHGPIDGYLKTLGYKKTWRYAHNDLHVLE